jgi:hypothetical protein
MQGLKILVIAMGVLILIGVTVLIVTVASRLKGSPGRGFAAASLVLPSGCRVVEMTPAGGLLALRLGDGPSCQLIVMVDPESGQEKGRLSLLAQP